MIELRCTLDRPRIRPESSTEVGCQLELRPTEPDAVRDVATLSTNLCLVFDCSASMSGAKADAAIKAAKLIVNTIDERHRISLVAFATSHWVVVDNASPAETGRAEINSQIDRLKTFIRGGTNLGEGIRRGIKVVQRHQADACVLVVLTDGQADSPVDAVRAGAEANRAGVQVFAVGIGDDFHADDLLKVVAPSGGSILGERAVDRLEAAFAEVLKRIESFVATNAQLTISLEQGVMPGSLYKTAPERMAIGDLTPGDRTIKVHVGNLERGQSYAYLLALTPPRGGAGEVEIARATLRYDAPARRLRDQRSDVSIVVTYDDHAEVAENADVVRAQQRAQLAVLVDQLVEAERKKDRAKSAELLEMLRERAAAQGDTRMLEALRGLTSPIRQADLNALVLAATARDAAPEAEEELSMADALLQEDGPGNTAIAHDATLLAGSRAAIAHDATVRATPPAGAQPVDKAVLGAGARSASARAAIAHDATMQADRAAIAHDATMHADRAAIAHDATMHADRAAIAHDATMHAGRAAIAHDATMHADRAAIADEVKSPGSAVSRSAADPAAAPTAPRPSPGGPRRPPPPPSSRPATPPSGSPTATPPAPLPAVFARAGSPSPEPAAPASSAPTTAAITPTPEPPAPPPPAPQPAPPPPPPPSDLRELVLVDPGPSVIELLRELRELTGLGLARVHELIQSAPSPILSLPEAEAQSAKKRLEAVGARITVGPAPSGQSSGAAE